MFRLISFRLTGLLSFSPRTSGLFFAGPGCYSGASLGQHPKQGQGEQNPAATSCFIRHTARSAECLAFACWRKEKASSKEPGRKVQFVLSLSLGLFRVSFTEALLVILRLPLEGHDIE